MFSLWLRGQRQLDYETGEIYEEDPRFLYLQYSSYFEALNAKKILEQVYGEGEVEIDQAQDYNARMGRF